MLSNSFQYGTFSRNDPLGEKNPPSDGQNVAFDISIYKFVYCVPVYKMSICNQII